MAKALTEKEILSLQKYRLNQDLSHSFAVYDLLDREFLEEFIANLAEAIGAPNQKIAASIFIKRYAFLAVISLYAMSAWNKKIDVGLDNVTMERPVKGSAWLPMFSFSELAAEDWNPAENREEWRKAVIRDLFTKNIDPVIVMLEKTFQISRFILWENIAVYLFWLYESELKDTDPNEDFKFLLFEADGSLFGSYRKNPIQKYYGEKVYMEEWGGEVRKRKTCCFTYQLAGSTKRCKVCPCAHIAKDGRCAYGEDLCGPARGLA
ncbi:IucA/IucC family C-terminal-domain containing protein [Neobacillus niacini]|uniref:IucA/IucC family C-terminal-domain containing protein n=1 Tax=Neobacillus niacini TaxID=86668 RepID=UPI0021CB3D58|nr:IucA/IucC family C-terminal-domain containing protein [Neobacillus niacini]MCM3765845.1 (2Fe-2S)-binding protein [Neobacillus niacini]